MLQFTKSGFDARNKAKALAVSARVNPAAPNMNAGNGKTVEMSPADTETVQSDKVMRTDEGGVVLSQNTMYLLLAVGGVLLVRTLWT